MQRILAVTALLSLALPGAAAANSIFGDEFGATFTEGGTPVATVIGTATDDGSLDISAFEGGFEIEIDWVDGDTVDVSFFGGSGGNLIDFAYTLSDLDFADSEGNPFKIIGASFNRGGSNIDEFLASDENPTAPPPSAFIEPEVSFTTESVTAAFSLFDERLVADGPRLRYDVDLMPVGGGGMSEVPLPASGLMLLAALTGLARAGRRNRPS